MSENEIETEIKEHVSLSEIDKIYENKRRPYFPSDNKKTDCIDILEERIIKYDNANYMLNYEPIKNEISRLVKTIDTTKIETTEETNANEDINMITTKPPESILLTEPKVLSNEELNEILLKPFPKINKDIKPHIQKFMKADNYILENLLKEYGNKKEETVTNSNKEEIAKRILKFIYDFEDHVIIDFEVSLF